MHNVKRQAWAFMICEIRISAFTCWSDGVSLISSLVAHREVNYEEVLT